ncbi:L-ascorbate metabolism protein UlaG (beta-lactamase superfamily) [Methanomicrobium sp. W14]|uniref:metal-dependent hydrolase n=1 Tax=Methanomicrobium sp. W14 TaxID=2817839 RepID=UPI001AE2F5F9|nr:metal-dependent hydrolase [Methanomicrobium sp. W14]MBP2132142.1 L-ascorbate metabolism protein UlaG (beta-lactamase superfamily) [Methanomicrobium sp. W14]
MIVRWLGHSCFFLEGSKNIMTDPFMPYGDFGCRPDIVAVTHAHGDHVGDAVSLNCPTVCPNELAIYLSKKGLKTEAMNIGGTIFVDSVKFTMVYASHSSSIDDDGVLVYGGPASGFVISMDGVTVYHAGDTGLFSDMKLIHEMYHPDIALLPIGSKFTMGPSEAMVAAEFVGAPVVIPMHYNTFPLVEQDALAFKAAVEKVTDTKVAVLEPGESIDTEEYL